MVAARRSLATLLATLVSAWAKESTRSLILGLGATPKNSTLSTANKDLFGTHPIDNWGAELIRAHRDVHEVRFHDPDADLFVLLETPSGGRCLMHIDANPHGSDAQVAVFQMDHLRCRVSSSSVHRRHWAVFAKPANYTCDWNGTKCKKVHNATLGSIDGTMVSVAAAPAGSKLTPATKDLFGTHPLTNYGSVVTKSTDQQVEVTFDDTDGTAFLRLDAPEGSCVLLVDANPVGSRPQAKVFQMSGLQCKVRQHQGAWSVSAAPAKGYHCDWDSFRCKEVAAAVL